MVRCLNVCLGLTLCGLLMSLGLLAHNLVKQADTHKAMCNVENFADPNACESCMFKILATVSSTGEIFFSYDWKLEVAKSVYDHKLYPIGDMFKCCSIDPLDCCSFGTPGKFCDMRGDDSGSRNCPSSPWKCTIHEAHRYQSEVDEFDAETDEVMKDRGVRGTHLTIGHDQNAYMYGGSAVAFLYAFLQLLYIRDAWGYATKRILAFLVHTNLHQTFRSLVARFKYCFTFQMLRKRARLTKKSSNESDDFMFKAKERIRLEDEMRAKRVRASITIQKAWRDSAARRDRMSLAAHNLSIGRIAVAECRKTLLQPRRLQWMYLPDAQFDGCAHRVTRTRMTYAVGQRIEILTVMLGPNEKMFLRLTKYTHIEDENSTKGFPGKALRPMVKRVKGVLADRNVTTKHALRAFNGLEVDIRDRRVLSDVVMDYQERPLILVFIKIAPEWTKQHPHTRLAFTREHTYRNAVPPPTTPYPNPESPSMRTGPSSILARPPSTHHVDLTRRTIPKDVHAIDIEPDREAHGSPYRPGRVNLPWSDPAYDQHYATMIDIE